MRRALAALVVSLAGGPALGQDVTLTARDGSIEIAGTLLSFDGEFYRVDTAFGALTVDGSGVSCEGPGCPRLTDYLAEIAVVAPAGLSDRLAPGLIRAFAAAEGYVLSTPDVDAGAMVFELFEPGADAPAGRFTVSTVASAALDEGRLGAIADLALTRSGGPGAEVVALDALVPLVAVDNRLPALSFADVSDALLGRISDWSALGGDEIAIVLSLPLPGSPARDLLAESFPGDWTGAVAVPDPAGVAARDPFALAFAPLSQSAGTRAVPLEGPCGIPKAATPETLKTEEYPLVLPIYLHARAGRLPRIGREFFAFARAPGAQAAVTEAGFVDQTLEIVPFRAQGDRLANAVLSGAEAAGIAEVQRMVADLRDFGRLTVSFRFRDGSTDLDDHSRSNVALVADAIDRGAFDGTDLIVAGFSDGQGDAASNLRLSRQRARAVREAILAALTPPERDAARAMEVRGYGEAAPIACDDVDWGRHLNRRVEIWVRQR
ncbi:OmpA family protein [Palleronia sp. KMU-117]|uniref:OmpA family protein n=1 Tax=Palleronia sp. KMU-117 TaxID=3434108 RepID=UPI003D755F6D